MFNFSDPQKQVTPSLLIFETRFGDYYARYRDFSRLKIDSQLRKIEDGRRLDGRFFTFVSKARRIDLVYFISLVKCVNSPVNNVPTHIEIHTRTHTHTLEQT